MNELTTKPNLPSAPNSAWGTEDISTKDVLIPKITLMQSSSTMVKQDKAKAGTLVNSSTNEVLANKDEVVEFIPIKQFREWIIEDIETAFDGKEKKKYRTKMIMDASNENLRAGKDHENGRPIFRTQSINFFVLIPSKLDGFPFLVPFKKSSLYTGKKLVSAFKDCQLKGIAPANQVWKLSCSLQTKDDNSYFVLNLEPGRATTQQELDKAYEWYQILQTGTAKVDENTDEQIPY